MTHDVQILPGPRVGFRWTRETISYALELWHRRYLCTPTRRGWNHAGPDHPCVATVREVFGSWNAALSTAGFRARGPGEQRRRPSGYVYPVRPPLRRSPAERIIATLRSWAEEHGQPPSLEAWRRATTTTPTGATVQRVFGSWNRAIEAAGYVPRSTTNACPGAQKTGQSQRR